MADEYRRFWFTSSAELDRELLLAAAFEAGAAGAEEVEGEGGGFRACVYGPTDQIEAIRAKLLSDSPRWTEIGDVEDMPRVDWSEAWKEGIEALRISERLVVRPPFVDVDLEPGQAEVVIDPGQAFGTGNHASTRLCLDWVDAIYDPAGVDQAAPFAAPHAVLDVGTGSGVLAFCCLKLGAGSAVGFDLDPVATLAASGAAHDNELADSVELFAGTIESLLIGRRTFPLILANLLKREILPIAAAVAACLAPRGRLILSGLLEEDEAEVLERFAAHGLAPCRPRREVRDETGLWVSPCLSRVEA